MPRIPNDILRLAYDTFYSEERRRDPHVGR